MLVVAFDTFIWSISGSSEEINILLSQKHVELFTSTWKLLVLD